MIFNSVIRFSRHRTTPIALLALGLLLQCGLSGIAQPVIVSEFMAANSGSLAGPGGTHDDWIEIQNLHTNTVNLAGWVLSNSPKETRGWTFPATNLPPSACLIVFASGRNQARPGAPLHTHFRLSSSGKYLGLRRPDGSIASDYAPAYPVQYADVSFGRLKGLTNATYLAVPTPGLPNESATKLPGPALMPIATPPAVAQPGTPIRIQVRASAQLAAVKEVRLHWRSTFRRETNALMTLGGDGVWTGEIPSQALKDESFIRWRMTATDEDGRGSKFPFHGNPEHSSAYLGAVIGQSPPPSSALPVFELFIPPKSMGGAESDAGARGCFFWDGEFYDNVLVKVRGNTTAGLPKKSHRLEFPQDHPLRHPGPGGRIRHTSLMAEFGDPTYLRQHLSFWLQSQAGSAAPFHYPVRVQLNGQFWQLALHSQVLGEELLERNGLDPQGALYKAVGTVTPDFYSTGGFEKKTRRFEGPEDYLQLAQSLHESVPLDARRKNAFRLLNIPAVINYLACARLTQEDDDIWANLCLYHDNDGTGEWRPIPFDMNVSWGLSFGAGGIIANQDEFRSHPFFGAADVGSHNGFNRLFTTLIQVPETRAMLLRRMRTLLDGYWGPPGTPWEQGVIEQHIAGLTNRMWADAILDRKRWGGTWNIKQGTSAEAHLPVGVQELERFFIEPRRVHLYQTHALSQKSPPLGITSRHRAGIPDSQVVHPKLEFADIALRAPARGAISLRLTNAMDVAVDLSRWQLKGDAHFTFEPGTVLPASGTLVVTDNIKGMKAASPGQLVVGPLRLKDSPKGWVSLRDAADGESARARTGLTKAP